MALVARYPDNDDRDQAEEMVKQLTAAPETAVERDRLVAVNEKFRRALLLYATEGLCDLGKRARAVLDEARKS